MTEIVIAAEPESGSALVDWITGIMDALGGPGAGLVVALENLFPPIPSEVILPLAGFTASQGRMSLLAAILWTTVGSLVGAVVLYYVGALLGRDRMRAIVVRIPLVKLSDVDKTEAWFLKHGGKTVFLGRMIPIFRSLISIPAGIERMPMPKFLIYTTLGSLIWNTALIMSGYWLGSSWSVVEEYVGVFQKVVIVVVIVVVVAFVVLRIRGARIAAQRRPGTVYGTPNRPEDTDPR